MSIEFSKLKKSFGGGKLVLNDLNFSLPKGKFSGLLGPSGCGKTTLLRILAGLDHPSEGRIALGDEVFVDTVRKIFVAPEKRNIGMVFQSYAVWPHMNVFENVAFPLRIRKKTRTEITTEVRKVLVTVRLEGLEHRMPSELSGGQQQRVALARALIQRPKLLLLDEPLSNLDASLRESMRQEIRQLQQELQITALIVTHDWADAKSLCDEIVVLKNGEIEQQGSPTQIAARPKSDFVAFLTRS